MTSQRLLTVLLLLQSRGRATTRELAERLEVSRRTILRDVEALSAAGVPVYTERGRAGGVVLLPGFRLDLSRLEPPEVDALALAGLDGAQAGQLGLASARGRAQEKIEARRTDTGAPGLRPLDQVVLVDNSAWLSAEADGADVAELALALRRDGSLDIRYRSGDEVEPRWRHVDPYGLVAKAGQWYLVADADGRPRLYNLRRLTEWVHGPAPAHRRPGQTLATVWGELRGAVERRGDVLVTARLRADRLDLARRILGARLVEAQSGDSGRVAITVAYDEVQAVRQLLQFGDHIEVLEPPGARELVHRLAADLATRHSSSPPAPD